MSWRLMFGIVVLCGSAYAADPRLDALRALLIPMRSEKAQDPTARGATPALTEIKHQLRQWIESRMKSLDRRGETGDLQAKLNAELTAAGLTCSWETNGPHCPGWWLLGYLSNIQFRREGAFLTLTTGVGIECGYDDSAYLYQWADTGGGWHQIWESEQNTYTKDDYHPQNILSVKAAGSSLVLTLGVQPWCASNWHDVYYRVFRLGPNPVSKPIVDGAEYAFEGWSTEGAITEDEALVAFRVAAHDPAIHNRRAIRHFKIKGYVATRIDPIALSPRDFVEEWLSTNWLKHDWFGNAATWSETARRDELHRLHETVQLHPLQAIPPTMHCRTAPDLWQVAFDMSDPPTEFDKPPVGTYFLVRWRPPYKFSMVSISSKADARCTEPDPGSDDPQFTLLPIP